MKNFCFAITPVLLPPAPCIAYVMFSAPSSAICRNSDIVRAIFSSVYMGGAAAGASGTCRTCMTKSLHSTSWKPPSWGSVGPVPNLRHKDATSSSVSLSRWKSVVSPMRNLDFEITPVSTNVPPHPLNVCVMLSPFSSAYFFSSAISASSSSSFIMTGVGGQFEPDELPASLEPTTPCRGLL
eukprot:CAMPEP_0181200630 /NCGR_PEP_ID=MMETSP1096-20121128/17873_1 /TAXON_ID=156174 ORGANISM="Chrysochromulina ericina, Strain CCMP281" /NCGR_SAMPLE_ID=MMETSP1096 /ASSEMBLY_ACC=CAM_ASM_000453 /LENGTH=181 /DNA_ID=CAMNT_0023291013 /DNA_START=1044 /DNA_END=1590 /DNA_ORIENTATION=+